MKKNLIYSGILVGLILVSLVSAGWFTGDVVRGERTECDSDGECLGGYCHQRWYQFSGVCRCSQGKTWNGEECVNACEQAGGDYCGYGLDNAYNLGDEYCDSMGCFKCNDGYVWDGNKCLESKVYLVYDDSSTMLDEVALHSLKLSLQLKEIGAEVLENSEVTKDMLKDKLTVFVYEGVATTIKEEGASSLLLIRVLDSMIQIREIKYNCDTIWVDDVYSDDLISISCTPKNTTTEPIPVETEVTYAGVLDMLSRCKVIESSLERTQNCNDVCKNYDNALVCVLAGFYRWDTDISRWIGVNVRCNAEYPITNKLDDSGTKFECICCSA